MFSRTIHPQPAIYALETRETSGKPMPVGLAQRLARPAVSDRELLLENALRAFLRISPNLGPKPHANHTQQVETWRALMAAEKAAAHALDPNGERG